MGQGVGALKRLGAGTPYELWYINLVFISQILEQFLKNSPSSCTWSL